MISLPGMKKNNMAAKYILLVFKVLFYQQTLNLYFGKQTVLKLKKDFTKVSRVKVSFSILTCIIGQFTQLVNFWLSFHLLLL